MERKRWQVRPDSSGSQRTYTAAESRMHNDDDSKTSTYVRTRKAVQRSRSPRAWSKHIRKESWTCPRKGMKQSGWKLQNHQHVLAAQNSQRKHVSRHVDSDISGWRRARNSGQNRRELHKYLRRSTRTTRGKTARGTLQAIVNAIGCGTHSSRGRKTCAITRRT